MFLLGYLLFIVTNMSLQSFLEEERKEFESIFVLPTEFAASTNEPIYDLDKRKEELKDWLHSHDTRLLRKVREMVERRKKYTNWSHTLGSHSDDSGDTEPCYCRDVEVRWKNQTFDEILNDDLLSSLDSK